MSNIALIAGVRVPTVYSQTSSIQPCHSALIGYTPQRLPDDAIGVFTLQLTNLVVGSSIQVETTSGVPLYNVSVTATQHSANFDVYSTGSPLNNLRIKVRKGSSAPYYQAWETLVVSSVGTQIVYVSQIPD